MPTARAATAIAAAALQKQTATRAATAVAATRAATAVAALLQRLAALES